MPNKILLNILKGTFRLIYCFDRRKPDFKPSEVYNILIINTTAIGDTLLSTPAIRAIRQGFPDARIAVLASNAAKEVLLNNPNINEIIDYPGRVDFFYIFKLPGLLLKIRRGNFDLVVIMHANDPDAAPLAYLSGASHRMGWKESRLAFLHTMPVKTRVAGMHVIDIRLKNLEILGIKADNRRTDFFLSDKEKKWAERFIVESGFENKIFIGIHPFGSKINKWWPSANVIEFCKMVEEKHGWWVIIFGGKKEHPFALDMINKTTNVISAAGRCGIRESAALIERCRVFISTDSGPMHMANALNIPLIALFGPDDPMGTGPLMQPYEIIQKNLSCIPCRLKTCDRGIECMQEITAEDVIIPMERLLKNKGAIVV
ncbi:MAG: lipopolysaccharide heptosyltransferase II [Deltaproteobacteria bacterium]|nr:lipopolysaccharide heptosyltransferase II [Deltaproteobacteria bacterium]